MKNTTNKKPNGYWENYENNKTKAQKYNSRNEFRKGCVSAYNVALKNNWLDNYTWFEEKQKPSGYWTYETCYQEAQKYNSRSEFEKACGSACHVARKNGWLDKYTWLIRPKQHNIKWTEQTCYNEAQKYNSRIEFQKGCGSAYHVARKNDWLDNYTWFEKDLNPYKNNLDNIYCYIFEELNSVYVGRTININERNTQHNTKTNSAVYQFAQKHNIVIPQITILETNLSLEQGREKEDFYVTKYKSEGWNVLNKAKTGKNSGSLGKLGGGKWNKKTCYQEAQKYNSRSEFSNGCGSAYNVACKNNWLDNYTWFIEQQKPSGYWTYETCYQEAQKYNSRSEFSKACGSAYDVARKNGWLDNYTWFTEQQKPNGYWETYENNYNEAQKYNSRSEFSNGCSSAYNVALKNNWLDNYTWFTKKRQTNGYWETYENNYNEAQKYKSRSEFSNGCSSAYDVARKNGWLNNYNWFTEKKKPSGYWTYETCFQEAQKYTSRSEFQKGCNSAYDVARENGWLDNYTWFSEKPKHGYWNYETCYPEAQKYKSRSEFQKGCISAYKVARKNGWLDIFFPKGKSGKM